MTGPDPYAPGSGTTPGGDGQPGGYGQPSGYGSPVPAGDGQPGGYGQPSGYGSPVPAGYGQPGYGPVGKVRSTGLAILLFFVTLGLYSLYWYFVTHEEMKKHTGSGLGGGLALVIAVVVGVASPFINSDEVGKLYERSGRSTPVSAATGLWVFPGIFLIFLPIVWFVKTNGALNEYWRSVGAPG